MVQLKYKASFIFGRTKIFHFEEQYQIPVKIIAPPDLLFFIRRRLNCFARTNQKIRRFLNREILRWKRKM